MKRTPNISYTTKHDICCGCGVCEGICPSKAITIGILNDNFRPMIDESLCNNEKGCHRCYDACPGIGINLISTANKIFKDENVQTDRHVGKYIQCYSGYSNDTELRYHAASGGLTTQFLIWLLENKLIDGAVVTRFDIEAPLKVNTFIATTKEELLLAKGSKYAPVSHAKTISAIKAASGSRYVIVGVPCQIEGFQKAISLDRNLRSKVVGLFAIYCSSSRSFTFTKYVMKERKINLNNLTYLAYRDNGCLGGLVAKGESIDYYEDYQSYCHPLRSIFIPRRCLLCIDHYGELADISFGDIHIEPYLSDKIGINSVIVRNAKWKHLLERASRDGAITLNDIDIDIINASQPSAKMKKGRNLRFVYLLKKFGFVVPDYDDKTNKYSLSDIIKYLHNRTQQIIGKKRILWFLIPLLKGKININ